MNVDPKWRRARTVTLVFAALGFAIMFAMAQFARIEITHRANLDSGCELKLATIGPSFTSWVRVSFEVSGDSEISKAHWRLHGNVVDVEK